MCGAALDCRALLIVISSFDDNVDNGAMNCSSSFNAGVGTIGSSSSDDDGATICIFSSSIRNSVSLFVMGDCSIISLWAEGDGDCSRIDDKRKRSRLARLDRRFRFDKRVPVPSPFPSVGVSSLDNEEEEDGSFSAMSFIL